MTNSIEIKPMKNILKIGITCFICILLLSKNGYCQNPDSNKEVVYQYFEEIVNKQKLELLETVFADSFRTHILLDNTVQENTITSHKEFLTYLFNAFPDIHTIGDLIEEGGKVVARVTFTATHEDEFWGYEAPENKIDYLSEIFFFKFKNGKIVESRVQFDLYNFYKMLGNNAEIGN